VTRPRTLVFVSGTATEVGKTWWTAATARELKVAGAHVAARKPVQSGEPATVTDAEVLAAATGEDPDTVCPPRRTYPLAWAPPMAARELGEPGFTAADLVGGIVWPDGIDVGLVEGVGGPRSPISDDGDNVELAHQLAPDLVVVVGDAGLGTINAVRLSVAAFTEFPVVVALNRYTGELLHERNLTHLVETDGFDVVTEPRDLAARLRLPSVR
jgi:dethiobiotin synthetase